MVEGRDGPSWLRDDDDDQEFCPIYGIEDRSVSKYAPIEGARL